jgi:Rrf2 family protein
MLEISQAVEYGIRGIMYMAQQGDGQPVLLRNIAEAEDISSTFLHKIFLRLTRSRILNSRRGVGYTLARDPQTITLLEIAEAIEGPIMIRRCVIDKDYCERGDDCFLASFWSELQEDLCAKLSSVTVRDLIEKGR